MNIKCMVLAYRVLFRPTPSTSNSNASTITADPLRLPLPTRPSIERFLRLSPAQFLSSRPRNHHEICNHPPPVPPPTTQEPHGKNPTPIPEGVQVEKEWREHAYYIIYEKALHGVPRPMHDERTSSCLSFYIVSTARIAVTPCYYLSRIVMPLLKPTVCGRHYH